MQNLTILGFLVSALVLTGCSTTTHRAQSVSISERICSIDSLRATRDDQIRSARGLADLELALLEVEDLNLIGVEAYRERTDRAGGTRVDEAPYGRGTEITRLVRSFETDLDASYRFAATSCQAYTMCMQGNKHDESACAGSRENWQTAQINFSETSEKLGGIREAIATMHIENQRPRERNHHHRHRH